MPLRTIFLCALLLTPLPTTTIVCMAFLLPVPLVPTTAIAQPTPPPPNLVLLEQLPPVVGISLVLPTAFAAAPLRQNKSASQTPGRRREGQETSSTHRRTSDTNYDDAGGGGGGALLEEDPDEEELLLVEAPFELDRHDPRTLLSMPSTSFQPHNHVHRRHYLATDNREEYKTRGKLFEQDGGGGGGGMGDSDFTATSLEEEELQRLEEIAHTAALPPEWEGTWARGEDPLGSGGGGGRNMGPGSSSRGGVIDYGDYQMIHHPLSDTAKCFSCMSKFYEAVWPVLSQVYKRPLNFTDLCDEDYLDPKLVPVTHCPTICVSMWEEPTVAGVRIRGHIRGCLDDLLHNGFNQSIVSWYRWLQRDSCKEYKKRELFKLQPHQSDDGTINVCTCYADHCNAYSSGAAGGPSRGIAKLLPPLVVELIPVAMACALAAVYHTSLMLSLYW